MSKNKMEKALTIFVFFILKFLRKTYYLKCKKAGNDKDAAKQCPSVIPRISELGIRRSPE